MPERWEKLQATDSAGVRHCSVCDHEVYFCASAEETIAHARAGHCIAREEPHPSELPRIRMGRTTAIPTFTSEQERAQELASREHGINTLLKGRLGAASRPCPECGYPVPNLRKSCQVCGLEIGRA